MLKRIFRSRAPLRISLAGGGTDVEPYPSLYGGAVISTTIDRYANVSMMKNDEKQIVLKSQDYGLMEKFSHISAISSGSKLDLLKATVRSFGTKKQYFTASIHVDSPPGSGLGSSSAVTVGLIGAFLLMNKKHLNKNEIAEKAIQIERGDMGIEGGKQDQYASVFGGFNFIEFKKSGVMVTPLRIRKEILNELLSSLVMFDTGKTRLSAKIIQRQVAKYHNRDDEVMKNLEIIKKNAYEMKNKLVEGKIKEIGEILHESWISKKKLDSHISNKEIDAIYKKALMEGAIGGKLMGAGGGGHFLFVCEPGQKKNLIKKITKLGYEHIRFNFDEEGLQTWMVENGKVMV